MEPGAKRAILPVAGALVVAAAIISALPERTPDVDPAQPSDRTSTTTSSTTGGGGTKAGGPSSAEDERIVVDEPVGTAKPFQSVSIRGEHSGGQDLLLQVQRREGERWVSFPVPTVTDRSGRFTTHVELDKTGRYWLRVLDPRSGATSEPFSLVIKD